MSGEHQDPDGAVASPGPAIEAQRARVRRLREEGAADYEVRPAMKQLEALWREIIIEQGDLVRRLRTDRAGKSLIAEAERRLEALKAKFRADTGKEWSDVREEGPVLLTSNVVRGNEITPELTDAVKQLKRKEAIRYCIYTRSTINARI